MRKTVRKFITLFLALSVVLGITGCGRGNQSKSGVTTIKVGLQSGYNWTPLMIMDKNDLVEKYVDDVKFEYEIFAGPTPLNEALAAGQIDVAGLGTSSYLISWDKMSTKIVSGVDICVFGLLTNNESIGTLADFTADDTIALPGPGSIQHICLQKASSVELGDPYAFDNQIVPLSNPDGCSALLGKSVTAHFATSPYRFIERNTEGIHEIINSDDIFGGDWTGSFLAARADLPLDVVDALTKALQDAFDLLISSPKEASGLVADVFSQSAEETEKYINMDITWDANVYRILDVAEFMYEVGLLTKVPAKPEDLMFDVSLFVQ